MAGIIFTPEQDLQIKHRTCKILDKYISDEMISSYPDDYYELHYLDLMCGNNIYQKLERSERKNMADEVFELLLELKPVIISTSINKLQMKKIYSADAYNPKQLAMGSIISKFSMYLTRHNMIGMLFLMKKNIRTTSNYGG